MGLFNEGDFTAHAGSRLRFKIECDALTDADLAALAKIIASAHRFGKVYGVPRGGTRLAHALKRYVSPGGRMLIVDDVLTSGTSMEEARRTVDENAIGVVIFARGPCPEWVHSIFQLSEWARP